MTGGICSRVPKSASIVASVILFLLALLCYGCVAAKKIHEQRYFGAEILQDSFHIRFFVEDTKRLRVACTVIVILELVALSILTLFHVNRSIILSRFLLILSIILLAKMLILTGTDIPDPNNACRLKEKTDYQFRFADVFKVPFDFESCNCLLFSGHASLSFLSSCFAMDYFGLFIGVLYWIITLIESIFCILSRRNYTMDVIVAFFITVGVYGCAHKWFESVGKVKNDSHRNQESPDLPQIQLHD
jgi:hypothetical protein